MVSEVLLHICGIRGWRGLMKNLLSKFVMLDNPRYLSVKKKKTAFTATSYVLLTVIMKKSHSKAI